jgi:hypothetical protein
MCARLAFNAILYFKQYSFRISGFQDSCMRALPSSLSLPTPGCRNTKKGLTTLGPPLDSKFFQVFTFCDFVISRVRTPCLMTPSLLNSWVPKYRKGLNGSGSCYSGTVCFQDFTTSQVGTPRLLNPGLSNT